MNLNLNIAIPFLHVGYFQKRSTKKQVLSFWNKTEKITAVLSHNNWGSLFYR